MELTAKLRDFISNGNWGLKLLSLLLAIIVYYAIKVETSKNMRGRDQSFNSILHPAATPHDGTTSNDGNTKDTK